MMRETLQTWLSMCKLKITAAATTTTAVGYVLFRGELALSAVPALIGIFLQACGAAALNQVQESSLDPRMDRTSDRPIPSGRISRSAGLLFAATLIVLGTALLWIVSPLAAGLGVAAAVVYNGIYTPMKRVSPYAAVPGSLIGAIPPVAGWVAAGGSLFDPTIHQVAFFFLLWQIPHFWLLLLFYERDYSGSPMPSMFERFDRRQLARITFAWTAAVAVAGLVLPMTQVLRHMIPGVLIAMAGVALVARSGLLLRDARAMPSENPKTAMSPSSPAYRRSCRKRFVEINVFALLVMALLVVDRVA